MAFTANDVLALSRAGYNSAQIAELAKAVEMEDSKTPVESPAKQEPAPVAVNPAEPAAPAAAAAPDQKQNPDLNESILAKLDALTTAVQMGNMRRDTQPEAETPDKILANIIRPVMPVMDN